MENEEKNPAKQEYVTGCVSALVTAFYETPQTLFDALIKSMLWLKLSEREVTDVCNEAIFTVKGTKITIADVLGNIADEKRMPVYCERTGSTEYKLCGEYRMEEEFNKLKEAYESCKQSQVNAIIEKIISFKKDNDMVYKFMFTKGIYHDFLEFCKGL